MSERDGGPAFPVIAENGLGHVADGMSQRDWFAGQFLAGFAGWTPPMSFMPGVDYNDPQWHRMAHAARAEYAYAQADAMLAYRQAAPSLPTPPTQEHSNE